MFPVGIVPQKRLFFSPRCGFISCQDSVFYLDVTAFRAGIVPRKEDTFVDKSVHFQAEKCHKTWLFLTRRGCISLQHNATKSVCLPLRRCYVWCQDSTTKRGCLWPRCCCVCCQEGTTTNVFTETSLQLQVVIFLWITTVFLAGIVPNVCTKPRYFKPKDALYLTITKCFLCLNLTTQV